MQLASSKDMAAMRRNYSEAHFYGQKALSLPSLFTKIYTFARNSVIIAFVGSFETNRITRQIFDFNWNFNEVLEKACFLINEEMLHISRYRN